MNPRFIAQGAKPAFLINEIAASIVHCFSYNGDKEHSNCTPTQRFRLSPAPSTRLKCQYFARVAHRQDVEATFLPELACGEHAEL